MEWQGAFSHLPFACILLSPSFLPINGNDVFLTFVQTSQDNLIVTNILKHLLFSSLLSTFDFLVSLVPKEV